MDLETITVLGVLAFLGWLYWHVVRAAHEGTLSLPEEDEPSPDWWPFSDGQWRGFGRSILISLPMIGVVIVLGWSFNRTEPGSTLYDLFGALGSLTGAVWLGLTASIILFNRPRFLVPRGMRQQLGVLQARRERRRARRAKRRAS